MSIVKPELLDCNLSNNCVRIKGTSDYSNQKIKSNASYAPKILLIPLGKFKGKYDTRKFRCYKKLCHQSNFNNCQHCKYLPYTSSPLKNRDYYSENIEIRDPATNSNQKGNQNELYNVESSLVCLLNDVIDDYDNVQNDHTNDTILNVEKVLDYYSIDFPSILKYGSVQQIEGANFDRVVKHFLGITNRVRSLALISSLRN